MVSDRCMPPPRFRMFFIHAASLCFRPIYHKHRIIQLSWRLLACRLPPPQKKTATGERPMEGAGAAPARNRRGASRGRRGKLSRGSRTRSGSGGSRRGSMTTPTRYDKSTCVCARVWARLLLLLLLTFSSTVGTCHYDIRSIFFFLRSNGVHDSTRYESAFPEMLCCAPHPLPRSHSPDRLFNFCRHAVFPTPPRPVPSGYVWPRGVRIQG